MKIGVMAKFQELDYNGKVVSNVKRVRAEIPEIREEVIIMSDLSGNYDTISPICTPGTMEDKLESIFKLDHRSEKIRDITDLSREVSTEWIKDSMRFVFLRKGVKKRCFWERKGEIVVPMKKSEGTEEGEEEN